MANTIAPVEKHLIGHYRQRFDDQYASRYEKQEGQEINMRQALEDFARALGFHDQGKRKINFKSSFLIVYSMSKLIATKQYKSISKTELELGILLGTTCFVSTYESNLWNRYSILESCFHLCYNVNQNKVRMVGREIYSWIGMRFDQFLTCSPITSINWRLLEKNKKVIKVVKVRGLSES